MSPEITYLIKGAFLGLSAGISPGPLLALVISETLRYNVKAGVKAAFAPLFTDLLLVGLCFTINYYLWSFDLFINIISIAGIAYMIFFGIDCLKTKGISIDDKKSGMSSLKKGIIINIFNPHPWLFWICVGVPLTIKAYSVSFLTSFIFLFSIYVTLIGSKVLIAILTGKSKEFLNGKSYIWIMRALGIALFGFAFYLILSLFNLGV